MSIFDRLLRRSEEEAEEPNRPVRLRDRLADLRNGVREGREEFPEDSLTLEEALQTLEPECRDRFSSRNEHAPQDAEARFFLSPDRMRAYACLLPPENGGLALDLDGFWEDLRYEGVTYGVQRKRVERELASPEYFHFFLVARGTPPREGKDGRLEELFQRRETMGLEAAEGCEVDFSEHGQPVQAGDVICRVYPAVPGEDGTDVTGRPVPCREISRVFVPSGRNTRLSEDGTSLTALREGVLYTEDGLFCVRPQKVIEGDLNSFNGVLRITGDLFITGSVSGGVTVEVTGDIVVGGEIRDASVTASGTIRVQKGVKGEAGKTFLKADRQIQAPSIENAQASAGGDVFAEVLMDSTVSSGGTVSVLGGRGLILGGHVRAERLVTCRRIGNQAGVRTRITVGYSAQMEEDRDQVKKDLAEVQETLEKLRKNIVDLRMAGGLLSEDKRELLNRLVEQRDLYEARESDLKVRRKELRQALKEANSGRIQCQELFPVVEVRIGAWQAELNYPETKCSIHVYAGQVTVR